MNYVHKIIESYNVKILKVNETVAWQGVTAEIEKTHP